MIVSTAPKSSSEANPERDVHKYLGSSAGCRWLGREPPKRFCNIAWVGKLVFHPWATLVALYKAEQSGAQF